MKISQIQKNDVIDFLRLDESEYAEGTQEEKTLLAIMAAAKSYILSYTGLTIEAVDEKEDFYIAYMVLCQDMHDNRTMYVDKNNTNKVVESVLAMHSVNLL